MTALAAPRDRRALVVFAVAGAIAAAVIAVALLGSTGGGGAPSDAGAEAQALSIERQLLCPQCTNKRLDVCELAICDDMKQVIRERLAAGDNADQIIFSFSSRYGPKVLADLPREGFNLALFGWVGGSLLLVAVAGGWFLLRLRQPSMDHATSGATPAPDDAWIDAQLAEDEAGEPDEGRSP